MLSLTLLVLAGLATVAVVNTVDVQAASDGLVGIAPFITGGREVNPRNSKPYQAFIDTQFNSYFSWCGASIISQNYILTAKHCVFNQGYTLVAVTITLGAHTLNVYESGQVKQRVLAANVRNHPTADASLIRTNQPIQYNGIIQPVRLPQLAERNQEYIGYYATASGWGRTEDVYPQSLRAVSNNIMSLTTCRRWFGNSLSSDYICMEGTGGRSVCFGDSGGPLVVRIPTGQLTQIGISAFVSGYGCNVGYPSAYTRLTAIVDWIRANSDAPIS